MVQRARCAWDNFRSLLDGQFHSFSHHIVRDDGGMAIAIERVSNSDSRMVWISDGRQRLVPHRGRIFRSGVCSRIDHGGPALRSLLLVAVCEKHEACRSSGRNGGGTNWRYADAGPWLFDSIQRKQIVLTDDGAELLRSRIR